MHYRPLYNLRNSWHHLVWSIVSNSAKLSQEVDCCLAHCWHIKIVHHYTTLPISGCVVKTEIRSFFQLGGNYTKFSLELCNTMNNEYEVVSSGWNLSYTHNHNAWVYNILHSVTGNLLILMQEFLVLVAKSLI